MQENFFWLMGLILSVEKQASILTEPGIMAHLEPATSEDQTQAHPLSGDNSKENDSFCNPAYPLSIRSSTSNTEAGTLSLCFTSSSN